METQDKLIKVMCDYCADGLWDEHGRSIDMDYLKRTFNLSESATSKLTIEINEWQDEYTSWDIGVTGYDKIPIPVDKFDQRGMEIARSVRTLLPETTKVIFFSEKDRKTKEVTI